MMDFVLKMIKLQSGLLLLMCTHCTHDTNELVPLSKHQKC